MDDNMHAAIRSVVNFSRNDTRYAALLRRNADRKAYFDESLERIAAEHGLAADELRAAMVELFEASGYSAPTQPYVPDLDDMRVADAVTRRRGR